MSILSNQWFDDLCLIGCLHNATMQESPELWEWMDHMPLRSMGAPSGNASKSCRGVIALVLPVCIMKTGCSAAGRNHVNLDQLQHARSLH